MEIAINLLINSLNITFIVVSMIMLVEYLNVKSRGSMSEFLAKHKSLQILIAALMGLTPGCIGAFAAVSMYTHRLISLGALVAAFIATFGDEAFFMLAVIPKETLILSLILFAIAIVTGYIVDLIVKDRYNKKCCDNKFEFHEHKHDDVFISNIFKKSQISIKRISLIVLLSIYLVSVLTGVINHAHLFNIPVDIHHVHHSHEVGEEHVQHHHADEDGHHHSLSAHSHDDHEHDHEHSHGFETILMIAISLLMLFVLLTTNKHFVDDHLWGHVLKDHALKIFLWTLGALTFITVLLAYFDINAWVQQNQFASVYIILIAVLVGVIPESGPHLIFIILYMNGVVPFSILLANSIVQDGHGSLPLIADSKKTFFIIKGISVILGLIFGFAGFIFGF
ncbi:MAG: arsenic efflux protein [Bacteroidales bacterium]|jgi:hypothetical protein|nr:arsenic efflux protein [Bacteroidales bacterium]